MLLRSSEEPERELWEKHEVTLLDEAQLASTEREAIVKARRGQGKFRDNVAGVERECRITRVSNPAYLIGKPVYAAWR